MENNTDSFEHNSEVKRDLSLDIAQALKKLEHFTEQHAPENLSSSLASTSKKLKIELARSFISLAFSEKAREKEREKRLFAANEVLKAIQIIQKNFLFIQKLKKGSVDEQALADLTVKVIHRYNQTIEIFSKKNLPLSSRISSFIYKKCGLSIDSELDKKMIHLPIDASVEFNYSANSKAHVKINQKAVSFIQDSELKNQQIISRHEADAFRVKAISLLRNHGIRFTSVSEEFQTIRSTPIQASIHSSDLKRILMTQVLTPFPGETIAFKGEFQRDSESFHKSVPLRESFEILTNSYQTGFPHPTQYTGFAFADCMIPLCPLRLDLLKHFCHFFKIKEETASALLPKGRQISKAKEILKMKSLVFEENKVLLLTKHLEFSKSLLKASPNEFQQENDLNIINRFFEQIQSISSVYDYLGKTQDTILQRFISKPFEKLKEDFVEQKNTLLYSKHFKKRYFAALDILETEKEKALIEFQTDDLSDDLKKISRDYICCMGGLIAPACYQILLQHMSETIGFLPPKLGDYEEKIQTALYRQLIAFQNELQDDSLNKTKCLTQFTQSIEKDIAIFKTKTFDELQDDPAKEIVKELGTYYHDHFYTSNLQN